MITAMEMVTAMGQIVMRHQRGTPEETAKAFNDDLAALGYDPNGVAAIGHALSLAWEAQPDMTPMEGISGALTIGLLMAHHLRVSA